MSYTISGRYLAGCSCAGLCGCPTDSLPRDAKGGTICRGVAVFHVAEGQLDSVDLSGVDFAFYNEFPSNLTSGNWKVGLVVDSDASADQAAAVERILSGQEGGPLGELAQFVGEFLGTERRKVALSDTGAPGLSVEGHTELSYQPLAGADGTPTTVSNAMFGFAPTYEVGRTNGSSEAFGLSFTADYGEQADFVFSSEPVAGGTRGRM